MTGLIPTNAEMFPYTTSILRIVGAHNPDTNRTEIDKDRLVALRALLTRNGINDTYSADECVAMTGASISTLRRKNFPTPAFYATQEEGFARYRKSEVHEWIAKDSWTDARLRLSEEDANQVRILLKLGTLTQTEIALQFGVSQTTISDIKRGRTWKHITS